MLRVRLLGELRLELDGRPLETIASRRARSLLAWLAYHPGLHARSRVSAVFWPDVLDTSARASLRTTLATLRRELAEADGAWLVAERERVGVADDAGIWIDVREIDRLVAAGQREEALALCGDDLLVDLDDDWVLEARRVHRELVARLLADLGDEAETGGDLVAAAGHARRRLELDPVSEDAARTLMRRLAASGDRAAAVSTYEAFREVLRRELGLAPSAETRALAESLRAGEPQGGGEHASGGEARETAVLWRAAHTPLVGRQEPLGRLREAWERVRKGSSAAVTVEGEAGSGKTRLLLELSDEARAGGATVLAGRCLEDGAVAFAPFTEALRPYLAGSSARQPDWVLRELARLLPELDPESRPSEAEPQDARHRLFEAVASTISQAAREAPALLLVDDLQWADAATVGMLSHVMRTLAPAPLLVAVSLRDEQSSELRALLGDLRRERRLERISLTGLSAEETAKLAASWLDSPASGPLAAALHRRSGGNPLFVEELVRHLVESRPGASDAELLAAAGDEVPEGLRSLIERRLARLPEPAAQAVRVAAVAGEEFSLADIAATMETNDLALGEALEAALEAGLVVESSDAGRYLFAHALVREAVIAELSATRRALLHRRLAEVIADDERRRGETAWHLLRARPLVDASTAARAALVAAAEAVRALAYEDATELLADAAAGDLAGDDPLRAEVLIALADSLQRTGDPQGAERNLGEAVQIARAAGDGELLARAALGSAGHAVAVGPERPGMRGLLEEALEALPEDSELRARLLGRLAIEVYYARPAGLREQLSAEAVSVGRRVGGRALTEALVARHVALWSPAHTEERLAIADELIATARAAGDLEGELQGVNWRVADLFELGEPEAIRAAVHDHERIAVELRLPAYAWYGPMWRATLALLDGDIEEARRFHEEGARIGRAANDENARLLFDVQSNSIGGALGEMTDETWARMRERAGSSPAGGAWRAFLLKRSLARGEPEGVESAFRSEVTAFEESPPDANWLYTANCLATLAVRLGDKRAAAEIHSLLSPYAHRIVTVARGCACIGSAAVAVGLLEATLGDRAAAIQHAEQALDANSKLGAVAFAALAERVVARLRDAREPLDEADSSMLLWRI